MGVQRQAELRDSADSEGYAEPNPSTGIGRARLGAGAAIVGSADRVRDELASYRDVGVDAFILSGYPHLDEAARFAELVLPGIEQAKIRQVGTS